MKYYRGNEPEDMPIWADFLLGFFIGTLGILGCPGAGLLSFGLVSMKIMLILSAAFGLLFACWLVGHRIKEE